MQNEDDQVAEDADEEDDLRKEFTEDAHRIFEVSENTKNQTMLRVESNGSIL